MLYADRNTQYTHRALGQDDGAMESWVTDRRAEMDNLPGRKTHSRVENDREGGNWPGL